jgi:hypothetical protein
MRFTGESLYNTAVLYLCKYGIAETVDYIRMDSNIITFIALVHKISLTYVIELFNLNHIYNALYNGFFKTAYHVI